MLGEDDSSPFVGMAYFQKSEHVRLREIFLKTRILWMAAKPYTNIWDVQTQAVHCLAVAVNSKSWLINLKKGGLNIWNHQKNKHLLFFPKGWCIYQFRKLLVAFGLGWWWDWQDTVLWNDLAGCCRMALQRGWGTWMSMRVGMVMKVTTFSRWWLQIFPYLGKIPILTSIFFKYVETTN